MERDDDITRREFMRLAAAIGATAVWGHAPILGDFGGWHERRELFPEGVASGDPDDHSVILWTRRPYEAGTARARLRVEVARDKAFARVVATGEAPVSATEDW